MENRSAFESFELQLTPIGQGFLKETAKWAFIYSIFGFIGLGFLILGALSMFAMGSTIPDDPSFGGATMGIFGTGMGVAYLISAVLYFFPVYYLYQFSTKAKKALENTNSESLTDSLGNLKSHFKFLSIFMIVVFVFAILAMLIGVVAGIGVASGM